MSEESPSDHEMSLGNCLVGQQARKMCSLVLYAEGNETHFDISNLLYTFPFIFFLLTPSIPSLTQSKSAQQGRTIVRNIKYDVTIVVRNIMKPNDVKQS